MKCIFHITCCIFAGLLMLSCATSKERELLEIHDTVTVNHVDTIRQYIERHHTDTVREKVEHIVTVNAKGDTIRETNNYYYNERVIERDSNYYYRHVIDSLKKSLDQNRDKEKEKKGSWWDTFKWQVIALILVLIYITFPNQRRKIS